MLEALLAAARAQGAIASDVSLEQVGRAPGGNPRGSNSPLADRDGSCFALSSLTDLRGLPWVRAL